MKKFKPCLIFIAGALTGCGLVFAALTIWLWGRVSFQPYGEVVFTDFPIGVQTITMENDLVSISTTDFTYHRDVPFEANLRVICTDPGYGEIFGSPWEEHFFFYYENERQGRQITAPINDYKGIHPITMIQAKGAANGSPSSRSEVESEGVD